MCNSNHSLLALSPLKVHGFQTLKQVILPCLEAMSNKYQKHKQYLRNDHKEPYTILHKVPHLFTDNDAPCQSSSGSSLFVNEAHHLSTVNSSHEATGDGGKVPVSKTLEQDKPKKTQVCLDLVLILQWLIFHSD